MDKQAMMRVFCRWLRSTWRGQ